MANFYLISKIFYFTLLIGALPTLAQITEQVATPSNNTLANSIVVVFMVVLLAPELGLLFRPYRREILNGIQNGDGVTNTVDLSSFAPIYIAIGSFRGIIFMNLYSMVDGVWEPSPETIWVLGGIAGGASLTQVKKIFGK